MSDEVDHGALIGRPTGLCGLVAVIRHPAERGCMCCLDVWATCAADRPLSLICRDAPADVLARLGDSVRGVAGTYGLLDNLVQGAVTHRAGDDRARRTEFGKHFSSTIGDLDQDVGRE